MKPRIEIKLKPQDRLQTFASLAASKKIAWWGSETPKVVFVVDPIVSENQQPVKTPINKAQLQFLAPYLRAAGLTKDDIAIISACPQVDPEIWQSDRLMGRVVSDFNQVFKHLLKHLKPKLVVAMGKTAARSVLGHAVKITNIRGLPTQSAEGYIVHPMFGLNHVISQPDIADIFSADFETVGRIVESKYSLDSAKEQEIDIKYRWCTDITFLLNKPPKICSLDAEWVGGEWYDANMKVLTIQLCWGPGKAISIPIEYDHKKGGIKSDPVYLEKIKNQLERFVLSGKTKFFGHNIKADWQMLVSRLGIAIPKFADDTILMAHAVDENMLVKSLDDCVRRWVPAMSGYADTFNRDPIHLQKSRMDLVPPDKMLEYGCGDVDATFRLRRTLRVLLKKDAKNYNCYRKVTLPAARALCDVERNGMPISVKALRLFDEELRKHQDAEHIRLLAMIPKEIVEKHEGKIQKTALVIRQALLKEFLFTHPRGLRIKPLVFTKSTRNKKDPKERVPSLSSKDHFPYFADKHPFVYGIIQFIKNEKLLGTYVGDEEEDSGFWKYINGRRIFPSYLLHRTVTGRTASVKPNGQNLPKRGKFAKKYRSVFVAPRNHTLIQADFSQLELRLVAIASGDKTMLHIYKTGGDIHSNTAAAINGVSLAVFLTWPEEKRDLARFRAKAVSFGFIYGMGWKKFRSYAKTEYGIDLTDQEAQDYQNAFFKLYPGVKTWHMNVRAFVQKHGYVRGFDGRTRHLKAVFSPDESVRNQAERYAINSPIQGFGSDLGLIAIARIIDEVKRSHMKLCGFVHDALISIAPDEHVVDAARTMKHIMETPPTEKWFNFKFPIPLIADVEIGKSLADLKKCDVKILNNKKVKSYDHFMEAVNAKAA